MIRIFLKNPLGLVGALVALAVVVVGVCGPWLAPHDPYRVDMSDRFLPPGPGHPFGTDASGRDVLSRVIVGTRFTLEVAVVVVSIALMLGMVVGGVAGYYGGAIGELLMRLTDIFLSFPPLVLALAVNAALGPGLFSAMLAVGFTWWPGYARVVRAVVLQARDNLYVEAARACGCSNAVVLLRHVLPNCWAPVIVQVTLDVGYAVLTTAGLSFVGLGAQPPMAEWGAMVAEGRNYILSHWWWSTFPGLALFVTVVGFNLLGDFLRDVLDPRLRKQ
ncbi:MAG: ABC transporter permease [Bacillota bacterium]